MSKSTINMRPVDRKTLIERLRLPRGTTLILSRGDQTDFAISSEDLDFILDAALEKLARELDT